MPVQYPAITWTNDALFLIEHLGINKIKSQYKRCFIKQIHLCMSGISLGMRPANERRRYNVTTSLIGWVHT